MVKLHRSVRTNQQQSCLVEFAPLPDKYFRSPPPIGMLSSSDQAQLLPGHRQSSTVGRLTKQRRHDVDADKYPRVSVIVEPACHVQLCRCQEFFRSPQLGASERLLGDFRAGVEEIEVGCFWVEATHRWQRRLFSNDLDLFPLGRAKTSLIRSAIRADLRIAIPHRHATGQKQPRYRYQQRGLSTTHLLSFPGTAPEPQTHPSF